MDGACTCRRNSLSKWIIALVSNGRTIEGVLLELREHRSMISVAAFLHNDVDHATQRTAVFRFNAGALDLNFLNEVKRNVGVREATGDIGGFLTFPHGGILRIRAAADHQAHALSLSALSRR